MLLVFFIFCIWFKPWNKWLNEMLISIQGTLSYVSHWPVYPVAGVLRGNVIPIDSHRVGLLAVQRRPPGPRCRPEAGRVPRLCEAVLQHGLSH